MRCERLDPALAVADVQLMDKIVDSSVLRRRVCVCSGGIVCGAGHLLAAIGTYGVIAYPVSQRTQEFGLRMALGAQRMDLLRMVSRKSARLAVPGTILGVRMALSLGRVMRSLIYGVSPADP